MDATNDGARLPERAGIRWYRIVSPAGSSPLRMTILANTFVGVWTHWDGRDFPCAQTPDCFRCREGSPNRWTGFVAAWDWYTRTPAVLRLTEFAARQLQALAERYGNPRGLTLDLKRVYTTKSNSKVSVEFVKREDADLTPPDFPIIDSVNRLLGLNEAWYAAKQAQRELMRPRTVSEGPPAGARGTTRASADELRRELAMARKILREALREEKGGN